MTTEILTSLAEDLERYLGDPHDDASRMPFSQILAFDESEQFPYQLVGTLQRWDVHQYCLPEQWGGRAGDVEVGFTLLRLVARRDPTSATALMLTDLAFMPAWIAGTEEQRRHYVKAINNGSRMAWGLSEREHGSDVLSNDMKAEKVEGGYLLTGEKYLIGNATVADVVSVHARTNERGGPGGWSIFAVDKRRAPAGAITELPNEKIHGLRALDMSGIRLDGLFVPDDARFGAEGQGLEIALKSAQVARTTISSMALGAVDTALRVTLDFVEQREIFGQKVVDIPYSKRQLAECFADLLLADAVATGAVRGLQANPGQTSIYSSAVKYFVPTLLERTMAQLSVVLGARIYLRSHPHFGIYQKMLRDVLVAIFADGNTVVNLKNIALELDGLLKTSAKADPELVADAVEKVHALYDVEEKLPAWQPEKQQLFSRGRDATVLALPQAITRLRAVAEAQTDADQAGWYRRSADLAEGFTDELQRLRDEIAANGSDARSAEQFRLAERYCAVHAAAAAVHLVVESGDSFGGVLPDGAVLLMMLERAWRLLQPTGGVTDAAVVDQAVSVLRTLHGEQRLFSPWQFRLSASDGVS